MSFCSVAGWLKQVSLPLPLPIRVTTPPIHPTASAAVSPGTSPSFRPLLQSAGWIWLVLTDRHHATVTTACGVSAQEVTEEVKYRPTLHYGKREVIPTTVAHARTHAHISQRGVCLQRSLHRL